MITGGTSSSPSRICPYCGRYMGGNDVSISYASTQGSSTCETKTPPIEIKEKPWFNFVKKVGRSVEKKVLNNVWKPIRG